MSVSMRDLDPAFQGAGQKAGIEVWRIENFSPAPIPKSSIGKFFTGDSYIVLKTTALKTGALRHDIHYWLGKDTSQDEAGTAAVKTVELDAALGGRAVQYREVQGHETEKFLSYFKPCIIPQEGGVASGFKHVEAEEHITRLFVCRGKHVVHVKEVPFARSSLNHDDIYILDTKSKIFQFNGSNSSIQERAKALEVVQYIKDTYHDGTCEVATVEDGRLMADAESGEFWGFFGGFAPLPRKTASDEDKTYNSDITKLFCVEKGQANPVEGDSLKREMLDTSKCYILDCGLEVFVWMGRTTSLDDRKVASGAAEEMIRSSERPKSQMIRIIEGFETVTFRSKFDTWTQETNNTTVSEDGRGRVAALLQRQGVNVRGLMKAAPPKEEPQAFIDCTGNLQVWRVNGQEKILLQASDHSKFYSGDCYVFQYSYPGEEKEEVLIGTWFGKQSVEEERASAVSMASKMVESMKFVPAQARIYEGKEPLQFFVIMQSFIVFKGGISNGYKKYIAEKEVDDDTYNENGLALFRIQGSGPENMQAIQVDPVASSLNSSYCYILHNGSSVFTWIGNLATSTDQELVERQLDLIKPNLQTRAQKEGSESEQFWELLGGKTEYRSQKLTKEPESDPHLFSCSFSKDILKVTEIYNFTQDDLMTEDIFIVDCHSEIFVWVGQEVAPKNKLQALTIGEKFIEKDSLLEKLSPEAPIYVIMEGGEPSFFTRFFTSWDSSKSAMHGNSFQRKLRIVKNGGTPVAEKPKRRTPASYSGRASVPDKSQQRTRSMSFSPERVRVRGRSPAFNALAATFESQNARNLSTPPPVVRKLYPRSVTPDSSKLAPKSSAISSRSALFEQRLKTPPREPSVSKPPKASPKTPESPAPESSSKGKEEKKENDKEEEEKSMSSRIESLTIQEDAKEGVEEEEDLPAHPYERLKTTSSDPVSDIDVTRREAYLSSEEFKEKFGMTKEAFYKLPKWKQNKFKMAVQLF
ncbi:villin-4 [Raphanus sativus]|uniref:Villin-4 n=1 Tax=Raphanus sativus TaxID=3726 RepID=A0A6J0KTG6_RAPSA|nr:villin-4 [Raphanus sativus]